MPEIFKPTNFPEETQQILADELNKDRDDPDRKTPWRWNRQQNKIAGSGSESAILYTDQPDKVLAYSYAEELTPEEAKEKYYLQRILTILFPGKFPKIYAATGVVEGPALELTGTIREFIPGEVGGYLEDIETFDGLSEEWEKAGFLEVAFDHTNKNFVRTEDERVFYVDRFFFNTRRFLPARLEKYLDDNHYSESDKQMVRASVARLIALGRLEPLE